MMKFSIEFKGVIFGVLFSVSALALAMAGGVLLQRTLDRPARSAAAASPGPSPAGNAADLGAAGKVLFLKNCAHCHGDDARGDEGPDLHGLKRPDDWIARRIRS